MAQETFWWVDGVAMPTPSKWSFGIQDISLGESGRTDDCLMHKNRVGQKRKIEMAFNGIDKDTTARILQAVNPEYIQVTYHDMMDNQLETRTFYVGDRSAPIKVWFIGNKRVESLSFNIIER